MVLFETRFLSKIAVVSWGIKLMRKESAEESRLCAKVFAQSLKFVANGINVFSYDEKTRADERDEE